MLLLMLHSLMPAAFLTRAVNLQGDAAYLFRITAGRHSWISPTLGCTLLYPCCRALCARGCCCTGCINALLRGIDAEGQRLGLLPGLPQLSFVIRQSLCLQAPLVLQRVLTDYATASVLLQGFTASPSMPGRRHCSCLDAACLPVGLFVLQQEGPVVSAGLSCIPAMQPKQHHAPQGQVAAVHSLSIAPCRLPCLADKLTGRLSCMLAFLKFS